MNTKGLPKIKEKRDRYLLPLEGVVITGIDTRNFLGFDLAMAGESLPKWAIEINNDFELTRFNQTTNRSPLDKETLKMAIDLIGLSVKKAEGYKDGALYLELEDGTEMYVPDGPYENWHLMLVHQERIKNTWVVGGVGNVSWFEYGH